MLLYYLFWMITGFILHIYIILGTKLLTGGPTQIAIFCIFQCFAEKEYQTKSERNETFRIVIFGTNVIQETWSGCQEINEAATRQGARPAPWARPPPLWAPHCSTDLLLPPIYIDIPQKHPGSQRNTISTAVAFCIREISSWSLRRHSVGGGIGHGGPLHQHPCPSDEL